MERREPPQEPNALSAHAPPSEPAERRPVEFCVVIPTYNERDNLEELFIQIRAALGERSWEVIVVDDDSPDGTAAHVRDLSAVDSRFRVIQRIGRRGLSSACIEGMMASTAAYFAVMDADLQHEPAILATIWAKLAANEADVVVATRFAGGGSTGDWRGRRLALSRLAADITARITQTGVTDPMSGFFGLRREVLDERVRGLSGLGFKILLDILLTQPRTLRIAEAPYTFGIRAEGASKFSFRSTWEFGLLLAEKIFGDKVPVRLIAFLVVGGSGVIVQVSALALLYQALGLPYLTANIIAILAAITSNYALNNALTYADRARKGWGWFRGLVSYGGICAIGGAASVWISTTLKGVGTHWLLATLVGIAAGSMWNFAASAHYTWSAGQRSKKAKSQLAAKPASAAKD